MDLVIAVVVLLGATLLFTMMLRAKDLAPRDEVSPTQHLEERRAAIYENLRDLQFEYLVGKLSDADYQQTKLTLQKELASVMTEFQNVTASASQKAGGGTKAAAAAPLLKTSSGATPQTAHVSEAAVAEAPAAEKNPAPASGFVCPRCGHQFDKAMKFCGECGKAMS